jgi:hypothetical protein
MSPELAPPGWLPHYVDYLILGLTTARPSARPSSVSRWAKLLMALPERALEPVQLRERLPEDRGTDWRDETWIFH